MQSFNVDLETQVVHGIALALDSRQHSLGLDLEARR